jgi:hypothetical protein
MVELNRQALVQVVMHSKEQLVWLRPVVHPGTRFAGSRPPVQQSTD